MAELNPDAAAAMVDAVPYMVPVATWIAGWLLARWMYGGDPSAKRREEAVKARRTESLHSLSRYQRSAEYRTAMHELGHLVCFADGQHTVSIDEVSINIKDNSDGRCRVSIYQDGSSGVCWDHLVGVLGGFAAEQAMFGGFRWERSRPDMEKALLLVAKIEDLGCHRPANWPLPDVLLELPHREEAWVPQHLSFNTVQLLDIAYTRARLVIDRDVDKIEALIGLLLEKGRLSGSEIEHHVGKICRGAEE